MRSTDKIHKNPLCDTPRGYINKCNHPQISRLRPGPGAKLYHPAHCQEEDRASAGQTPPSSSHHPPVWFFVFSVPVTARETPDRDPGGDRDPHRNRADETPSRRIRATPRSRFSFFAHLHPFAHLCTLFCTLKNL